MRIAHDGMGSGFICTNCGSWTTYVDFVKNDKSELVGLLIECCVCLHVWVEGRVFGNGPEGHN